MTALPQLRSAAAASLAKWHAMAAKQDFGELRSIVHPDVIFRSPVAYNAYNGADALVLAIGTVATVFQEFAYYRQAATADGVNAVLEFGAKVAGKDVKGIDFIRFDEDGKIVEFEVMIRPLSGLQALAEEMGKRLGGKLPDRKDNS